MEEKGTDAKADESDDHESEDESEILEESPCGRWLKRSEEVSQRNVPGIDRAYLAMDSEEGVEVVWNEVQFSERKSFKQQEEKIKAVFDNLMRINHANIVKFHRYWIDYSKEQQRTTRVVFITEYMSSGSVKEFLNKTKDIHKYKRTKSWKRWCTQILSALTYLHNCVPPVIHGNMTCDTIFIQHNGLVKIGSVAPDAIRNHVKTYHEIKRNMHYYAPEYGAGQGITPAVDIYSFGICALEMAVPRSQLHYKESKSVTATDIERAIDVLDDPIQRDFIRLCLCKDPTKRPSARSLLLHPLLFEVHSLKLLAAHAFVKNQRILPEYKQKEMEKELVIAEVLSSTPKCARLKDVPTLDVDKFLEDVKNGVYPLTSFALPQPPWPPTNPSLPSQAKGPAAEGHTNAEQVEEVSETRRIISAQGSIMPVDNKSYAVMILLRFEDKMNRHLSCEMMMDESAETLSAELVQHRLVRGADKDTIKKMLDEGIKSVKQAKAQVHFSTGLNPTNDTTGDQSPNIPNVHSGPTNNPLTESSLQMIYSNFQSQMPKAHVPLANPMVQANTMTAPVPIHPLQGLPQPMLNQQIGLTSGSSTQQQNQTIQQQSAMQHHSGARMQLHLAHGGASTHGQMGLTMPQQQNLTQTGHQIQLQQFQFLQYLQQQQALAGVSSQTMQQLLPQIQASHPVFVQAQIPTGTQGLYVQHQPGVTQQNQQHPPPGQRHVHFQNPLPVQPTPQSTGQQVFPVLLQQQQQQQQQFVAAQGQVNPTLVPLQQPRMQANMSGIPRSGGFYSLPHSQSNNNSNNIFTRSNSKVDDISTVKVQQPHIQQGATPHSSSTSVGSTIADSDYAGAAVSPPASQTAVSNGGGDSGTLRM